MKRLKETVTREGQTLYAPILACRPRDADKYPRKRRHMYYAMEEELGKELSIYPGSVYMACEKCGIEVSVGPRQQQAIELAHSTGLNAHVMCMIDAAIEAAQPGTEAAVESLGNPFERTTDT